MAAGRARPGSATPSPARSIHRSTSSATPRLAEERGFEFALISDHFHPWIDRQGNSPFVWGVLGAIAQATERLEIGTGVTCPTMRIHPAIIAQAAATAAALMPGRFFLGVGTGENLNEHILGHAMAGMGRPRARCWRRRSRSSGSSGAARWRAITARYYTVENARLYTLPETLPADPRRRQRRADGRDRRADRRRLHRDGAGRGDHRRLRSGRRPRAALRPGDGLLGTLRGGGTADRPRVVADRGDPRRGHPGAARARATSSSSRRA